MKLVVTVVVALLIGYGYANRPEAKPVVFARATQARAPLPVVMPTNALEDLFACEKTPSQCSLQNGVPDWTMPAYGCDWNYGTTRNNVTRQTSCVPDQPGDYDCPDLLAIGLSYIRVIGEDWMLLDEDGDGIGCEFDRVDAEIQRCESLYEPDRTACLDEVDAYLDSQYEPEYPDDDHQHDYDPGDYYEQDPAEFCPRC